MAKASQPGFAVCLASMAFKSNSFSRCSTYRRTSSDHGQMLLIGLRVDRLKIASGTFGVRPFTDTERRTDVDVEVYNTSRKGTNRSQNGSSSV